MSDSLQLHELQHTWLPCPSLSPRVCSNSFSLSRWCHSTISLSVTPFSYFRYFPRSEFFPMNHLWIWYKIDLSVSFYHVDKIKPDINGMNTLCNFWYSKVEWGMSKFYNKSYYHNKKCWIKSFSSCSLMRLYWFNTNSCYGNYRCSGLCYAIFSGHWWVSRWQKSRKWKSSPSTNGMIHTEQLLNTNRRP